MNDYGFLKSGSDIRGTGTLTSTGAITLTDEVVGNLSCAFFEWLALRLDKRNLRIAIGGDSRLSTSRIMSAAILALKSRGAEILDCGLCSTPAMFMMTRFTETNADGAIMVTASHLPYQRNGLKFFVKEGGLTSDNIDELLWLCSNGIPSITERPRLELRQDFLGIYTRYLVAKVQTALGAPRPLEGLRIIVDASNGASGFFTSRVLEPLGADTTGSQCLVPDGKFPFHVPDPENIDAMTSLKNAVLKYQADLGIIFDADGDRSALVFGDGQIVNRNKLLALVSAIVLGEAAGATIVTDSATSDGLTEFITKRGGVHRRFKRGYNNVIGEAKRLNLQGINTPLAIETSGHIAFTENFFLDDGAYLVTRVLIKLVELKKQGKTLFDLISDLSEPEESCECRITFNTDDWKNYGNSVIKRLTEYASKIYRLAPSTFEGVRINIDIGRGFFMARMSVHDPVMVLNIESNQNGGVKKIARLMYAYLDAYKGLDITNLKRIAF